jgi:hypothetical protein
MRADVLKKYMTNYNNSEPDDVINLNEDKTIEAKEEIKVVGESFEISVILRDDKNIIVILSSIGGPCKR